MEFRPKFSFDDKFSFVNILREKNITKATFIFIYTTDL